MSDRYSNRNTVINNNEIYKNIFSDRNVSRITQYPTQDLRYPTKEEIQQLTTIPYIWKSNDKYWKLSDKYYGDPKYWWLIAFFNQKPIEMEIAVGDIIYIVQPLEKLLGFIKG